MSYIDEIFARASIQHIRTFLLEGTELRKVDTRPYKERLESAERAFTLRLQQDYPDPKDFDAVTQPIFLYGSTMEDVYMEIGLQIGASLAAQFFQNQKVVHR